MATLFAAPPFAGFGPGNLRIDGEEPAFFRVAGSRSSVLRANIRKACPRCPGVYGMLSSNGELIYIGKAKSLRSRLLSYFRPRSRDPKAGRILARTRAIVWEPADTEFAALLRELELIRRWRPCCNVQGQPFAGRYAHVCIGRAPAPYIFLDAHPPARTMALFGPVSASRRSQEAIRWLNTWYQLRDCPQSQEIIFADQAELFPVPPTAGCLRYEIGTCLGPCTGACSRSAYAERVRAARAFLAGRDKAPIKRLEADMKAASAALEFERAAQLRDRLESLRWFRQQLERLRRAEQQSFIYRVQGSTGAELWYLIHHGRAQKVISAPDDPASKQDARAILKQVFQNKRSSTRGTLEDDVAAVLLVEAWFRRHPEERARIMPLSISGHS